MSEQSERLRNAAVILAGLVANPNIDLGYEEYAAQAWKHLATLESASPPAAVEPKLSPHLVFKGKTDPNTGFLGTTSWKEQQSCSVLFEFVPPEPSGNPGELRPSVRPEPTDREWEEAESNNLDKLYNVQRFQYCMAVSAEAYRLAAEREAKP